MEGRLFLSMLYCSKAYCDLCLVTPYLGMAGVLWVAKGVVGLIGEHLQTSSYEGPFPSHSG